MFTGLIEERGRVERIEERPAGRRFEISSPTVFKGSSRGDSIAVDGCCLTAIEIGAHRMVVEAVPETLRRTTLGDWSAGTEVNLERSLRLDSRLGGHLVQGHVDGVGRVVAVDPEGDGRRVRLELPGELSPLVAEKGSLAVDGVSLTVAACRGTTCEIAYIPHTLAVTTAGSYAPGRRVNLEVDLMARYVARLLEASGRLEGSR
ncbi:MAG TPA: riboflavin synthase [Candidatus Sulfotelmatobacter sp.]|nr:riboflavin synthase [Candidatus Sulfotelmatobacter sp.]